eukprot:CAMPEP_0201262730 /NCGR_PEP_ID=MMETSP0853-20130426/6692_1 /ASSEMBLY_ACC=CAM_ASM_000640 /TAXON_ID=183588 /ORGANISM="Pseudo-nitzschia fraudulenta, Strain WWA7" /LENGTH=387 /DNA_ID=CAMNT_0047566143 /DNA_START=106 /DNA_END=1270 /DNA_ORIENTATION=+
MGSKGNKKSCGKKICCYSTTLVVVCIAAAAAWYFFAFAKDVEKPIGDCGGCYCIPDETTSFGCPSEGPLPTPFYSEDHQNAWKSQTILNPYVLNCNPYADGVFCDTEPPLDPDFQWVKLGETAVCAIHYQAEGSPEGLQTEVAVNPIENTDNANVYTIFDSSQCENTAFYRIKTYPSRADAESAGGFVTHTGNCGVCSTLQDLAVYANEDFVGQTSPGNFCRRQAATSFENGLSCYRDLGLTQDCAKLWADTSWNTAKSCFGTCVLNPTLPQWGTGGEAENNVAANSTETSSDKWYDLPSTLRTRFTDKSNETDTDGENYPGGVPSNGPSPECALNACITCNEENQLPLSRDLLDAAGEDPVFYRPMRDLVVPSQESSKTLALLLNH